MKGDGFVSYPSAVDPWSIGTNPVLDLASLEEGTRGRTNPPAGRPVELATLQPDPDRDIICAPKYTWDCDNALAVFHGPTPGCPTGESGGRWDAVNPGNLNIIGGFQIHAPSHEGKLFAVTGSYDYSLLLVSTVNTNVAHLIYLASGSTWAQWDCKPSSLLLPTTGIELE